MTSAILNDNRTTPHPHGSHQLDEQFCLDLGRFRHADAAMNRELAAAVQRNEPGAKDRLVLHNTALVIHIAHKLWVPGYDMQDVIQVGVLGLLKAAKGFRPDKGIQFSTYAYRCIENMIYTRIISAFQEKHTLPEGNYVVGLGLEVGTEDGDGTRLTFADPASLPQDGLTLEPGEAEELRDTVRSLRPRYRTAVELRYGLTGEEPMSLREIGERIGGVTPERVRQILLLAFAELRQLVSDPFQP